MYVRERRPLKNTLKDKPFQQNVRGWSREKVLVQPSRFISGPHLAQHLDASCTELPSAPNLCGKAAPSQPAPLLLWHIKEAAVKVFLLLPHVLHLQLR